ncbi:MAG: ArsB/NhaD family transporter [Planctomycetota bacterium]|jgi:Na+/H+ antiporter NhaD/arsenite permease-like protein
MPPIRREGLTPKQVFFRGSLILALTACVAGFVHIFGYSDSQILACTVFAMTVLATLFFWEFRLAVAFLGIAVLFACNVLTLDRFVDSCELPVILFLVGMMVIVGVLKELGFFSWIIQLIVGMHRMNGVTFTVIVMVLSALLACAVDEVTSIVFVCALVFQVCDTLRVAPTPFLIIAVMATNIGSAGTMVGNPVGLLISHRAGFTFEDFIVWAFPVMVACLVTAMGVLLLWFRKEIRELSDRLDERRRQKLDLGPLVPVPYRRGLIIFVVTVGVIAAHHRIEMLLGLEQNTLLMTAPLAIAGLLMVWRRNRAKYYIGVEVDWWELLFFMMLFAKAGALEHTGVASRVAKDFATTFHGSPTVLLPVMLGISAIGSAFVDNVVFVAAFVPVVTELGATPLWWALLFGACLGGNVTVIGSAANIIAAGVLERRHRQSIDFVQWLKVGIVVGMVTCIIAWLVLTLMAGHMPPQPG